MKLRRVAFMRKDEAILSEAIREEFPNVMFLPDQSTRWEMASLLPFYDCLSSVPGRGAIIVFPDHASWSPPMITDRDMLQSIDFDNFLRHRTLVYQGSFWDWDRGPGRPEVSQLAYDPPTIGHGTIYGMYYIDDPDHEKLVVIARQVFRIIARIATNRVKGGHPLGNLLMGRESATMAQVTPDETWCGHTLLEWCQDGARAGFRRMMFGNRRPCDDWEVPTNPWYQRLRRRAEELYAADFTDPPDPPK
ncbi:MAG: hypothetical protein ACREEE_07600 [Dongiaceae bacterium]